MSTYSTAAPDTTSLATSGRKLSKFNRGPRNFRRLSCPPAPQTCQIRSHLLLPVGYKMQLNTSQKSVKLVLSAKSQIIWPLFNIESPNFTRWPSLQSHKRVHLGSCSGRDLSMPVQPILKKFTVFETVIQGFNFLFCKLLDIFAPWPPKWRLKWTCRRLRVT